MPDAEQTKLDVAQSGLTPWKLIQTYSPDEWEHFIVEWSEGFQPAYQQVIKLGELVIRDGMLSATWEIHKPIVNGIIINVSIIRMH